MNSIHDFLKSLQTNTKVLLENTRDTWRKIGKRETIHELADKGTSTEEALREWIEENPYNNVQ